MKGEERGTGGALRRLGGGKMKMRAFLVFCCSLCCLMMIVFLKTILFELSLMMNIF